MFKRITFSNQYILILAISLFMLAFDNVIFFQKTFAVYEWTGKNFLENISLIIAVYCCFLVFFGLLASRYTTKALLIFSLLASSGVSYFAANYNTIIDDEMIRNSVETSTAEAFDLLSYKLAIYILLLGVLPAWFVYQVRIQYYSFKKELLLKLKFIIASVITVAIILLSFGKFYASFLRENKPLRFYVNPLYWVYSTGKFIQKSSLNPNVELKIIGDDAQIITDSKKKKLVIMVVGEALRADKLSFNGYERETTPLLKKEEIINFSNVYSCGTSTAVSVPCMFSVYDRSDYAHQKALSTHNILDVLSHTKKVDVLWRDNNSSSKGVALRVDYQDFRNNEFNKICDPECRDEGMLLGLDEYIKKHKGNNILIVLHQMGNHGPAYYKRYPKKFEKFLPVCKTNQLEECTDAEVRNAYDNAVLYTDYFLSKVINFLKQYSDKYEIMMIYSSDHGESLGESGLYLHGMPYFMAPDNQKHIASLVWFGKDAKANIDYKKLLESRNNKYSHDNLFHTLLGLFKVKTSLYDVSKDMFYQTKKKQ